MDAEDLADVGVIERSSRLCFAQQAGFDLLLVERFAREELERYDSAEPSVLSLVDDTHTTLAELSDHTVVADGGADVQDVAIVALCDR
jgi:hypothetical protein